MTTVSRINVVIAAMTVCLAPLGCQKQPAGGRNLTSYSGTADGKVITSTGPGTQPVETTYRASIAVAIDKYNVVSLWSKEMVADERNDDMGGAPNPGWDISINAPQENQTFSDTIAGHIGTITMTVEKVDFKAGSASMSGVATFTGLDGTTGTGPWKFMLLQDNGAGTYEASWNWVLTLPGTDNTGTQTVSITEAGTLQS